MVTKGRRQRERENRRIAILRAARETFEHKGIAAATMDDVARAAEVSKGTLYLYFRCKDELFMALGCEVLSESLAAVEAIAAQPPATGLGAFRAYLACHIKIGLRHFNTIRNAFIWMAMGDQVDTSTDGFRDYSTRVLSMRGHLEAALLRGQGDGSVRTDKSAATLTALTWGSAMGCMVLHINAAELKRRFPGVEHSDDIIESLIDVLCAGLAAVEEDQ